MTQSLFVFFLNEIKCYIKLIIFCHISINILLFIDKNAAPKANAGGDKTVIAPVNALILNGSLSSDDLKIKQWLWSRDPNSLAIGNIVEGTEKSPVLMV